MNLPSNPIFTTLLRFIFLKRNIINIRNAQNTLRKPYPPLTLSTHLSLSRARVLRRQRSEGEVAAPARGGRRRLRWEADEWNLPAPACEEKERWRREADGEIRAGIGS